MFYPSNKTEDPKKVLFSRKANHEEHPDTEMIVTDQFVMKNTFYVEETEEFKNHTELFRIKALEPGEIAPLPLENTILLENDTVFTCQGNN